MNSAREDHWSSKPGVATVKAVVVDDVVIDTVYRTLPDDVQCAVSFCYGRITTSSHPRTNVYFWRPSRSTVRRLCKENVTSRRVDQIENVPCRSDELTLSAGACRIAIVSLHMWDTADCFAQRKGIAVKLILDIALQREPNLIARLDDVVGCT